ncbi:MAG: GNAT family N-acetyltransferase [Gemmataceae bacterium]
MNFEFKIDDMRPDDWPAVAEIYRQGIATGNATFDTDAPSWEVWNSGHAPHSRFVARRGSEVLGWVALSPTSSRCCYAGVAEVSYYIAKSAWGQGVATALLQAAIKSSEDHGIWTLTVGIFPENAASLHLAEKCGFRVYGRREKLGHTNGVWRDVIYAERRSKVVGVNPQGSPCV